MAEYRERVSITSAITDSAMIAGGFVVGGFLGRKVEDIAISTPVVPTSSTTDKVIAGAANNAPKIAAWYLLSRVGIGGAAAAMIGSAAYDILIRLTNDGVNPYAIYTKSVNNYRILSQQQNQIQAQPFSNPTISERQRRYGSMPTHGLPFEQWSEKTKRERKYGFASPREESPLYQMYGMR